MFSISAIAAADFVGHLANQHRNFVEPREPGGAHPALAGDDLVASGLDRAHQHRLHDALGLDAFGQLVQRALVHAGARLVRPGCS